ncbi:MAG: nicotinate-nucleotide--dimethylbenzimidazole phosphoribosyltransferase [Magnetococcales bacterium]|nr:nicotinate-nucleotide--dimethylbenzimidazole phosphoribosyltransferase [Magnetococcales bacterium]
MRPDWINDPIPCPSLTHQTRAMDRQNQLTKPPGSLGRLEEMAIRICALQGRDAPSLDQVRIVVFAGDHGVARAGVSAYPQAVTLEMVRNFSRGGAAINVLARQLGAHLEVVDVGVVSDPGPLPGVISRRAGFGTADFRAAPAMSEAALAVACAAGAEAVRRARESGCELFIGGEMGIGNTTAATALACALLDEPPQRLAGPGTGLDPAGVARKVAALEEALTRHASALTDPWEMLRHLGGFEIAALTGSMLAAAQQGMPLLVDGFIVSVAALTAVRLRPETGSWLLFAHESAEPGHRAVLAALQAEPLLRLGMRLGEASGAALAVPLLRCACALHREMATFVEAGVSGG